MLEHSVHTVFYYYYLGLSKQPYTYLERKITENFWVHPFQCIEMSTKFTEALFVLKKKNLWTICAPWKRGMYQEWELTLFLIEHISYDP